MTVVSFENATVTFNQALSEVLREYFDGGVHKISDVDLTFPAVEVRIDSLPINETITTAIITLSSLGSLDFRKYKCQNPNDPTLHGYEVWATVMRNVSVAIPIHGGQETKNTKEAHRIWGLMYAIFASKTTDFAIRKIFKCELPPIPEDIVNEEASEIAHCSGILTCEIHLPYACYNLSEI